MPPPIDPFSDVGERRTDDEWDQKEQEANRQPVLASEFGKTEPAAQSMDREQQKNPDEPRREQQDPEATPAEQPEHECADSAESQTPRGTEQPMESRFGAAHSPGQPNAVAGKPGEDADADRDRPPADHGEESPHHQCNRADGDKPHCVAGGHEGDYRLYAAVIALVEVFPLRKPPLAAFFRINRGVSAP